jgi:translation elongation factor EF-4
MSFTEIGFRTDNLVKLDIRINGEDAPPLATIVHRDKAHDIGKKVCDKLKELIPRQQFKVSQLISLSHLTLCMIYTRRPPHALCQL